jgi:hypothetical protein
MQPYLDSCVQVGMLLVAKVLPIPSQQLARIIMSTMCADCCANRDAFAVYDVT